MKKTKYMYVFMHDYKCWSKRNVLSEITLKINTFLSNPSSGFPTNAGPICYECSYHVIQPRDCDVIKVCSADEVCTVFLCLQCIGYLPINILIAYISTACF